MGGPTPSDNNASSSSSSKKKTNIKNVLTSTVITEKSTLPPGGSKFSRPKTVNVAKTINPVDELDKFGIQTVTINDQNNEADICQQLLVNGFVQSYVDFYHLTNRADPNVIQSEGKSFTKIQTSFDDMIFIRDNLVGAETARRQGNTAGVYEAYNKLADLYASTMDWRTCIFFHEKRLEVSQLTSDDRAVMLANHSLGTVYQKMGDYAMARKFHEQHEEVAGMYDVLEEVARANVELYKVYMVLATRLEHAGNIDEALEIYQKCLQSAKKCWDKAAEGETNGKIGSLLLFRKDAEGSLPYLKEQSQIAADMADAEGRCRACSALALALDILGQADKALAELTLVHSISEQAGDDLLQAQACKALGTLYSKVGKLEDAFTCLSKHFTLVKQILADQNKKALSGKEDEPLKKGQKPVEKLTSDDLDMARLYVGVSKGNFLMGSYVTAIQLDVESLLEWKLNRSAIPSVQNMFTDSMQRDSARLLARNQKQLKLKQEEEEEEEKEEEEEEVEIEEGEEEAEQEVEEGYEEVVE